MDSLKEEVSHLRLSSSFLALSNMRLRCRLSGSIDLDISECASPLPLPPQDEDGPVDLERMREKYDELRIRHFYLLCLNIKQEYFLASKYCNVTVDKLYENFPDHLPEVAVRQW